LTGAVCVQAAPVNARKAQSARADRVGVGRCIPESHAAERVMPDHL
jgi:hypothetical protein